MNLKIQEDELLQAARAYGISCYNNGLYRGIMAIETIRGWLTRQPDNEWQQEVRAWVDALLRELEKEITVPGDTPKVDRE